MALKDTEKQYPSLEELQAFVEPHEKEFVSLTQALMESLQKAGQGVCPLISDYDEEIRLLYNQASGSWKWEDYNHTYPLKCEWNDFFDVLIYGNSCLGDHDIPSAKGERLEVWRYRLQRHLIEQGVWQKIRERINQAITLLEAGQFDLWEQRRRLKELEKDQDKTR